MTTPTAHVCTRAHDGIPTCHDCGRALFTLTGADIHTTATPYGCPAAPPAPLKPDAPAEPPPAEPDVVLVLRFTPDGPGYVTRLQYPQPPDRRSALANEEAWECGGTR